MPLMHRPDVACGNKPTSFSRTFSGQFFIHGHCIYGLLKLDTYSNVILDNSGLNRHLGNNGRQLAKRQDQNPSSDRLQEFRYHLPGDEHKVSRKQEHPIHCNPYTNQSKQTPMAPLQAAARKGEQRSQHVMWWNCSISPARCCFLQLRNGNTSQEPAE